MDGVTTTNLQTTNLADEILVNHNGSTRRMLVERLVALLTALLGPTYATRAQLLADLNWPANSVGYVRADSNTALNGVYKKSGSPGSGSWTRVSDLPTSAVEKALIDAEIAARIADTNIAGNRRLTNIAGTANAITASYPPNFTLAEGVKVTLVPVASNTGNVTLNGLQVQDADGNQLAPGTLMPGRSYVIERGATNAFRIISGLIPAADLNPLKNRANHTGTQPMSSVAGLETQQQALAQMDLYDRPQLKYNLTLPFGIANGDITASFDAAGTWKLPVERLNTPNTPVKRTAAGLEITAGGEYFRALKLGGFLGAPFGEITFALAFTIHSVSSGTNVMVSWDNSGLPVRLSLASFQPDGAFLLRLQGPNGLTITTTRFFSTEVKHVVACFFDYSSGRGILIDPDGNELTATVAPASAANPSEIRIGQNLNFTLHNLNIAARGGLS